MDTYSAAAVGRMLNTSAPRVLRAIERLGMGVARQSSGALAIDDKQLRQLAAELGTMPSVPGLSRSQARVLAALGRSPRGLASVRAVARRAGVSPTSAGRALVGLIDIGLVRRRREMVARGAATPADVYTAAVDAPQWHQLAAGLARIELPSLDGHRPARQVPSYLRHLFWNTAASQLVVDSAGPYIAKRLLTTGDPDGLAWGVVHLPRSAWAQAAQARGLSARDRALAENLSRNQHAAA